MMEYEETRFWDFEEGRDFQKLSETTSATIEVTTKDKADLRKALELYGYSVKEETEDIWQVSKTVEL